MKKVFEPVTTSLEKTSQNITKTMMLTSKDNNKAKETLNDKRLEIMKDRGIIASYLLSPLSKSNKPGTTTQFKLVKDSSSNRVNGLKIHNSKPITLYNNLLTFRDTGKEINLKGDHLEMITDKNYSVDLASLADKK